MFSYKMNEFKTSRSLLCAIIKITFYFYRKITDIMNIKIINFINFMSCSDF